MYTLCKSLPDKSYAVTVPCIQVHHLRRNSHDIKTGERCGKAGTGSSVVRMPAGCFLHYLIIALS